MGGKVIKETVKLSYFEVHCHYSEWSSAWTVRKKRESSLRTKTKEVT
jgi:hypothetical protein